MATVEQVKMILERRVQEWIDAGNALIQGEFRCKTFIVDGEPPRQCACALGTLSIFDGEMRVQIDVGTRRSARALDMSIEEIESFTMGFDHVGLGKQRASTEWYNLGAYFREKYYEPQINKELRP